jgi:hypothetical protein
VDTSSRVERHCRVGYIKGEVGGRWRRVETERRREKGNGRGMKLGERKGERLPLVMRSQREGRERETEIRVRDANCREFWIIALIF